MAHCIALERRARGIRANVASALGVPIGRLTKVPFCCQIGTTLTVILFSLNDSIQ